MPSIILPKETNELEKYRLQGEPLVCSSSPPPFSRIAYAAPHLIINPLSSAAASPSLTSTADIDWDATLGVRESLWEKGLGVAEAMDTSQRGMGLDWHLARELIARVLNLAKSRSMLSLTACGAGTDQLTEDAQHSLATIESAYREQMEYIQSRGGSCILMASRALAHSARRPEDYIQIYGKLLQESASPCILHWLGDMFDPALHGYWGSADYAQAAATVLNIIQSNSAKVVGIKISLLNEEREIFLRNRLPADIHLFTGNDFNYPSLIRGDATRYSDALLGVFTPIATAASLALEHLATEDFAGYERALNPTLPLARELFAAPTRFYKAGIGFIAWLNDQQSHFIMPAGLQAMRTIAHYSRLFRHADQCGLLQDPPFAIKRMQQLLKIYGVTE